jgi:hypothetical protein
MQVFPGHSMARSVPFHPPVVADPPAAPQGHISNPTPRVMFARLPEKETKPYKPYHDKSYSLPPDLPTSGSDNERAKPRELVSHSSLITVTSPDHQLASSSHE